MSAPTARDRSNALFDALAVAHDEAQRRIDLLERVNAGLERQIVELRAACTDATAKLGEMGERLKGAEGAIERVVSYTRETPCIPDGVIQQCREALARIRAEGRG